MKYKLIGVERRGDLLFALVLKQKDDKQEVYLETGEKVSLHIAKTIHTFAAAKEASDEKSMKIALAETRTHFSQESVDMAMLWECLELDKSYTFAGLLENYFGQANERQAGALLVTLSQDAHYFQLRDGGFVKRPPATVEANLRREKAEKERRLCEASLLSWLKNGGQKPDMALETMAKFIEALKKYALEGEESTNAEGKRLAQFLELSADELLEILEKKGVVAQDINEALYRFELAGEYPAEARTEGQKLAVQTSDFSGRKVVKDIWSVAIDDAETEEVDDALSYHQEHGCHVIGIHIADVAFTIPSGGALDKFARERFATIYLPEIRLPLFPFGLVKKKLTLAAREPRPTLSGFFYFDDTGNLVCSEFAQTMLHLQKRGTYEQTAESLGQEPEFRQIYDITLKLREKRVKAGAIITQIPDLKIKVKDGHVSLSLVAMNLPGHTVVSELMILFNVALAEKFTQEKIPAIFRTQAPKPEATSLDQGDPLYPLKLRWTLGGAVLATTPAPHFSVGASAYVQATSPIRRYTDLILHRQLIAAINKAPLPYSEAALQELKPHLERAEKAVKGVEIARNQFWIYKYLQANAGKTYAAIVSRVLENQKVMVFIPELLQEFPYHIDKPQEGTKLTLKVMDAQPRYRRVQWALVTEPNLPIGEKP